MASESHILYSRTETATSPALPKYRFVAVSSGKVGVSSANALPYGISVHATTADANAAQRVRVAQIGVVPVEASSTGAVARGARVASAANGKAKTATTGISMGGIALSSGAAGEVFPILFAPSEQAR